MSHAYMLTRLQANWRRYQRARDRGHETDGALLRAWARTGLVSIVLPTHNGARHVDDAIHSVVSQTWPRWELIVVDDGSTDRTAERVESWVRRDNRIRLIRQPNMRLPGALNTGFRAAEGEFHTWTSDDNRMRPRFLTTLVEALRARPDVDAVYADYDLIDEAGRPVEGSPVCRELQHPAGSAHIRLPREPFDLNLVDGNYLGGAFLYRAHVTRLLWGRAWGGPYSPNRFLCEDYDFFLRVNEWLRLEHAGSPDSLYEYRLHPGSLTARDGGGQIQDLSRELLAFDDFRRDMTLWPVSWRLEGDDATGLARRLAEQAVRRGDRLSDEVESLPWLPAARVRVQEGGAAPAPDGADACARVLICREPPTGDLTGWDLVLTRAEAPPEPPSGNRILRYQNEDALWRALRVAAWQRQAEMAEARAYHAAPPRHRLSVVVATNRPAERLAPLIDSLAEQGAPADDWELLLIDNAPARDETALRAGLPRLDEISRVRIIHNPVRGLSISRNAGVAAADGQVILFLDDDVTAAPECLESLLAAWGAEPEAGVIGGAVRLAPVERPPRWLGPATLKYWAGLDGGRERHQAIAWRDFPYGCAWSARADTLRRIGGFRGRFGRGGIDVDAGEETVAALQIQALGQRVLIDPDVRVVHHIPRERITLGAFLRIRKTNADALFTLSAEARVAESPSLVACLRSGARQAARAVAPVPRSLDRRLDHLGNAFEHLWLAHRLFYYRLGRVRLGRAARP